MPYKWSHNDSIDNLNTFNRYLNWLGGEFILYQQDEVNGIKVYFPNGWFSVKKIKSNKNQIDFIIEVRSKCLKTGSKIYDVITSILVHAKAFETVKKHEQLPHKTFRRVLSSL